MREVKGEGVSAERGGGNLWDRQKWRNTVADSSTPARNRGGLATLFFVEVEWNGRGEVGLLIGVDKEGNRGLNRCIKA